MIWVLVADFAILVIVIVASQRAIRAWKRAAEKWQAAAEAWERTAKGWHEAWERDAPR